MKTRGRISCHLALLSIVCLSVGRSFDYKLYAHFLSEVEKKSGSAESGRDAYSRFSYYPRGCHALVLISGIFHCAAMYWHRPHCDKGRRPGRIVAPSAVAAFPVLCFRLVPASWLSFANACCQGGSVKRLFGECQSACPWLAKCARPVHF